jgi:endonuclease/exonuclease/phosphatase family metal-dependent hydrolase
LFREAVASCGTVGTAPADASSIRRDVFELDLMGRVCFALAFTALLRLFGYVTDPLLDARDIHRLVGEPERIVGTAPSRDQLKIVTWNIERGDAYASVLTALRGMDADVLLLQEVDRECRRTGFRDVARDLARALDMNWVGAGEFQEIGEGRRRRAAFTGQATLSKFPISNGDVLSFRAQDKWRWSINPVQPRRGGRIALRSETAGVVLYNIHIESGHNDRLQRQQMMEILESQDREMPLGRPVVIGGDFNNGPILTSAMFGSLNSAAFADALGASGHRGPTSSGETHPIDWIFVKNITSIHGRVVDVIDASDHFPVMAALTLNSALAVDR